MPHTIAPPTTGRRLTPAWPAACAAVLAGLVLALSPRPAAAQQRDIPLPPPPPGMKRIPLPPPPPGTKLQSRPGAAPAGEQCSGCHSKLTEGRVVHGAMTKHDCTSCHRAVTTAAGKCKSRTASKWALVKTEPELCYGCHARKDQQKSVHTVIRQGSCLSCHASHSSNNAGLINQTREQVCFDCHDVESLTSKPVKHAPVTEGRCLDCHDAHGGNLPNNVKAASGSAFCMKCHDAKAPVGKGTPGAAYRIDLTKKVVHPAFKKTDCLGCHEGGHGSDRLKLLKKNAVDLCYGCHERKDKNKFPHGAVLLGDCAVCHDPHSSDSPKLVAKPTVQQTCFLCHQDDLTGRKFIHAPIAKGCDQCHDAHGAQSRNSLKVGEGKAGCYKCHKPVDTGKNKHAALERYGCDGCHDPHGTDEPSMMGQKVNDLCKGCHPNENERHVTPLAPGGHPIGGSGSDLVDPKREGRRFTCASCHNPHGSDSPKLLRLGSMPMESCAWCHGDKGGSSGFKDVTRRARAKPPGTPNEVGAGAGGAGPGAGSGSGLPGTSPSVEGVRP